MPPFYSQSSSLTPSRDANASALAKRSLELMGAENLAPGKGIELQGNLRLEGKSPQSFPVLIRSRTGGKLHVELQTPSGTRVTVIGGGHGQIRHPDGTKHALSENNLIGVRNEFIPALSLLTEFSSDHVVIENKGHTSLSGMEDDVIAIGMYLGKSDAEAQQSARRTRTEFHLNSKTGHVMESKRLHYFENNSNDSQTIEIRYSDYRNIDGVWIPFHQETYADEVLITTLELSSASINVPSSDSDFELIR